jgi:hydrogenase/urease accessory protein HupE
MRGLLLLIACACACACAGAASAHDARPLSIAIVEQTSGLYRVVMRAPPTVDRSNTPQVLWPEACVLLETAPLSQARGSTSLVSCPDGLENQAVRIEYPSYNPSITTLIRVLPLSGVSITAVMPPDQREWIVPAEPTFRTVARDYLLLGFGHIWQGKDHLLFVAGLLLLARVPRKIFWAVTGFTAAHSITLSLAALGYIHLAVAPVEAMIALSILFLATEIARNDPTSFSSRYPIVLSFVFGLLHGFGFASALGEIGLPRDELAAGLLFFNLGVEAGQLAFIAAAGSIILAVKLARTAGRARPIDGWLGSAPVALAGSYCLGVPAAFWFLERTATAFSV